MENQESKLNITEEELERFQNAMKNEEFRKMFSEYAKEISDPENKKRYEAEIAQLEAERGMDVKFINPQDGFVVKMCIKNEGGKKAFINICQSDAVGKATSKESSKKIDEKNVKGQEWSIPYSLNQPRDDLDKAGKKCTVYDIIFHTKTYEMGQENPRFKELILNTTFDAIEGNWKVKLDRKNLKYPKMKFKGTKTSTIIRTSNDKGVKDAGADIDIGGKKLPYPYKDKAPDLKEKAVNANVKDKANKCSSILENDLFSNNHSQTPKYSIVHRGHLDLQNFTNARDSRTSTRPQELVVNIELPLCESSGGVDLDIYEKQLILDCCDPTYHLDIALPYPVNEDEGRAQFDKSKRKLIVTLPVIPAPPVTLNGHVDVEAAESMVNGLVTEIVDDKDDSELNRVVSIDDDKSENSDSGVDENDCDVNNAAHDSDGVKNVENISSNFGNADVNGCKDVVHEQYKSPGVKCPVFKTPPYSFHQNNESVTFVLHVSNVSLDTMSLGFNGNKCSISFPSTSITSTNFLSPGYALYIQFPDDCLIDSQKSSVDLNEVNLALVLHKQEKCVGMWQWFMIGSDEHTLEKTVFVTEDTLPESLNEIKDNWVVEALQHKHGPGLSKAHQPITANHKVESTSVEESVIQLDVQRENTSDDNSMGNILASTQGILFSEVQSESSEAVKNHTEQSEDSIKSDVKTDCDVLISKKDTVVVSHADLDEVEVVEENYEDENEADDLNEPQRLTTVQENEPTIEGKDENKIGTVEMQKARAIKCRKNRRRRRRSTGSHDQSSSVSEEEVDGSTRRGKQREKHGRRSRMSRSLSFGSSADSHDDIDGHRSVRFNPVPEVHVFSNRADKRKWKELRKQQLLNGNTELDNTSPGTGTGKICKLKSSLKDTRLSVSSDDGHAGNANEVAVSSSFEDANEDTVIVDKSCEDDVGDDTTHNDADKGVDDDTSHNDADNDDIDGDDVDTGDDIDGAGNDNGTYHNDDDESFVKVEKPQLTNPLIFDLDD